MMSQHSKTACAIEIVGIDNSKGLVNGIGCHEDGMGRPPGFGPALEQREAGEELVEFLKDILYRDSLLVPGTYLLFERFLDAFSDYKYDFTEAGTPGIEDRVIHDGF